MRSRLAKVFDGLFLGMVLVLLLQSALSRYHVRSEVQIALWVVYFAAMVLLPFLAGLVWDDPRFAEPAKWKLIVWVALPAAMLVVVVVAFIIEPPDIPDAWYVLIGVAVWNLLLPIGRLIGMRVWRAN